MSIISRASYAFRTGKHYKRISLKQALAQAFTTRFLCINRKRTSILAIMSGIFP